MTSPYNFINFYCTNNYGDYPCLNLRQKLNTLLIYFQNTKKDPIDALSLLTAKASNHYPCLNDLESIIKASYIGYYFLPSTESDFKAKVKKITKNVTEQINSGVYVHPEWRNFASVGHSARLNLFAQSLNFESFNSYRKFLTKLNQTAINLGFESYDGIYRTSKYLQFKHTEFLEKNKEITLSEEQRTILSQCLPYQIDLFFESQSKCNFLADTYKHWYVFFELEESEIIAHAPLAMKLNRDIKKANSSVVRPTSLEGEVLYSNGEPEPLSYRDLENLTELARERLGNFPVNFNKFVKTTYKHY